MVANLKTLKNWGTESEFNGGLIFEGFLGTYGRVIIFQVLPLIFFLTSTRGSTLANKNRKYLWKLWIFTRTGRTQSFHFWSNFEPSCHLKLAEIEKNEYLLQKLYTIGLSKYPKIKALSSSPINYFLYYLSCF